MGSLSNPQPNIFFFSAKSFGLLYYGGPIYAPLIALPVAYAQVFRAHESLQNNLETEKAGNCVWPA